MAALKYSRQREAIKNYLQGRRGSSELQIWSMHGIREEFPNISLGTVYRKSFLINRAR